MFMTCSRCSHSSCSTLGPPLPHPITPGPLLPAAFKQQNAVHGLPLELSAEEVTLAVEKGWGQLAPALGTAALAAALGGGSRKRGHQPAHQYYEEEEDEMDAEMADAAAQQQQQQQPVAEPTWRPALASGATFVIPTTLEEATAANEGRSLDEEETGGADNPEAEAAATAAEAAAAAAADAAAAGAAGEPGAAAVTADAAAEDPAAVQWTFPATREERHRYWVFRDLHSRGWVWVACSFGRWGCWCWCAKSLA